MKNATLLVITLSAALIMISCEKEELTDLHTVTGLGETLSMPLDLDPFEQIDFNGVANLYVFVGDVQSVQLSAQQNIMNVLTWEVNSGVLIIDIKKDVFLRDHEEIRFDITIPDLVKVVHDGVGDINLGGDKRDEFYMDYRGVGHIDAYALPVDHCTVLSSGVGDCKVRVEEMLEVDLSGIGSVFYRGFPQITNTVVGIGQLINDN